jgi:hypothetical protein
MADAPCAGASDTPADPGCQKAHQSALPDNTTVEVCQLRPDRLEDVGGLFGGGKSPSRSAGTPCESLSVDPIGPSRIWPDAAGPYPLGVATDLPSGSNSPPSNLQGLHRLPRRPAPTSGLVMGHHPRLVPSTLPSSPARHQRGSHVPVLRHDHTPTPMLVFHLRPVRGRLSSSGVMNPTGSLVTASIRGGLQKVTGWVDPVTMCELFTQRSSGARRQ